MCNLSQAKQLLSKHSKNAKNFILSLLNADPKKRPNVRDALSHAWFDDIKFPIEQALALNRKVFYSSVNDGAK